MIDWLSSEFDLVYIYRVSQIDKGKTGAIEKISRHPSVFLIAGLGSSSLSARSGTVFGVRLAIERAVKPDTRVEASWAGVVDHWTNTRKIKIIKHKSLVKKVDMMLCGRGGGFDEWLILLTFTSVQSHLGKQVGTRVAAAANNPRSAFTLAFIIFEKRKEYAHTSELGYTCTFTDSVSWLLTSTLHNSHY